MVRSTYKQGPGYTFSLPTSVYGVAQRVAAHWAGNSGASARDMAVPSGRNHPPPEVLFQQGAQKWWMPDPDALELPEANDLYPVVCEFVRNLNVRASPGFDCIAAPFIKYAGKEVPAFNGRGVEKMTVLAPYFACSFALMMEKAQIPEMWKAAKVTPLHKRGPVLDPNNYRMLAVSGIMYRLYVNVLRVYVTEWCQTNNKIPDTQFGFYPGRFTLQPILSSDICCMLRKHKNLMAHLGCMQHLLTSSRHMTPFLGVPFGSTSNTIACPPAS